MINPDDDYHWQQEVAVKSVGLGYLGEFALAIGQAISEFVPKIYGLRAIYIMNSHRLDTRLQY